MSQLQVDEVYSSRDLRSNNGNDKSNPLQLA